MSEAATSAGDERIERLERKLDRMAELLEQGGRRNEERAEDILARLPAEDRELLERERFRRRYSGDVRRMFEEFLDELDVDDETEDEKTRENDDGDEETDEDEEPEEPAAKAKPKPRRAKAKPAPRHPGRHTPAADELPAADEPAEPWWRRD